MSQLKKHKRLNESLLAPYEKPLLLWLAARMPAWVNPDLLTGLGFAGAVLIFISFILCNIHSGFLWLASLGLLINWFGDSLDGTLARYRKIERPRYGFFLDHAVDALAEVLVFVGVGLSPYVDLNLALLTLVSYLLCEVLSCLILNVRGVFRISFAEIGPTEIRLIGVATNALIFFIGNPVITLPWGVLSLYNVIVSIVGVMLFVFYLVLCWQELRVLAVMDRKPSAD